VLGDFAKADADWLADFLSALCAHAPLLAAGDDATYQTRVVEAMRNETDEQEDENGI
jgi:PTH1 family peptidyl-tRNA hydrolase